MRFRDSATHCLLAANHAYLTLTGYTFDELKERGPGDADHWRDQPQVSRSSAQNSRAPEPPRLQAQIRRKSGTC